MAPSNNGRIPAARSSDGRNESPIATSAQVIKNVPVSVSPGCHPSGTTPALRSPAAATNPTKNNGTNFRHGNFRG